MKTRCVRVEDALAASQLWVRMQLLRQTPTKELHKGAAVGREVSAERCECVRHAARDDASQMCVELSD